MTLDDYMNENGLSVQAMADRVGVTRQSMWRYRANLARPSWDVMERIRQITDDAVLPNDFLETVSAAE